MDKKDFIATLMGMYRQSFTDDNFEMWTDVYTRFLPLGIDYKELYDDMISNYKSSNIAPSTAFFKPYIQKQLNRIKERETQNQNVIQIKEWKKEIEEIEKHDRPVTCEILSPLDVLKSKGINKTFPIIFSASEMKILRDYVNNVIPTHKLQCDFWVQVCKLITGGKTNELCRDM